MDNDIILRQFQEIEQKVERLIEIRKSLETKNSELQNKMESLEQELQIKVEAENRFIEERAMVRSKIDGLLGRLEDISEDS